MSFVVGQFAAQQGSDASIIKLKNGSKIIGKTIEDKSDKLTIVVAETDTIEISKSQIKNYQDSTENIVFSNSKYHRTSGIGFRYEFGFGLGESGFGSNEFGLYYKFNKRWELGAGIGFKTSNYFMDLQGDFFVLSFPSIPLFAQGRYYLTHNKWRLFLDGQLGYAINQHSWNAVSAENGINYGYGAGICFSSKRRSKWYLTLGFDGYTVNSVFDVDHPDVTSDITFDGSINALTLGIGVEFGR